MQSKASLPTLREYADGSSRVAMSCQWSIGQMTGEKAAPQPIRFYTDEEWFLKPLVERPN
jgi:hypothetical protein